MTLIFEWDEDKAKSNLNEVKDEELRPEYDFTTMKRGQRGKYYQAYRAGHMVTIHKADGTTSNQ